MYFDAASGWLDTPVFNRAGLTLADRFQGPAIIEEMSATTVLYPGQTAVLDAAGNLIVTVTP